MNPHEELKSLGSCFVLIRNLDLTQSICFLIYQSKTAIKENISEKANKKPCWTCIKMSIKN